jgi:DNA-binding GntR family transcriptional regulator
MNSNSALRLTIGHARQEPVPYGHHRSPKGGPLTPRALYQDVAERLRQQIFNRELEPGSWIDELKLAAEYGISRTPLREALKVLAAEGLVTMKVRRGAYVTEMSPRTWRRSTTCWPAGKRCRRPVAAHGHRRRDRRTAGPARRLEKQVRQRDAFFATNERFHMRLLDIAGNRWRDQIVADLRKVMKLNRHHSLFKRSLAERWPSTAP